ncbi:hypothetical protein FACS189440_03860 [Bacteroidia bacterium]|nr:hypothetical protein FACS189440_03860 [Bacteroidia bacterium]
MLQGTYRIAGHLIAGLPSRKQETPDIIPGFSRFHLEKDMQKEKPLLRFDTGIPLSGRTTGSQHSFLFEQFICDFSSDRDVYLFRMVSPENNKCCLTEIHPDGDGFRAFSNFDNAAPDYVLRFAVWIAFGVAAVHRQTAAIHSSAVMCGGKSVLFLGESGTGKSTHTRLWLDNIPGTELLNDDSPFMNVSGDIRVYGSPWSGKTPCYKNRDTPVAALVRLRQAPCNKIRKLNGLEAIGAVLPSFPPAFAYDKTLSGHMHGILSKILGQTPVYALDCLPDAAAAELVFDTLKKDGRL